ncbi:MAG: hypothetical protein ACLQGT_14055 [Terracidiphilus sp.]
MKVTTSPHPTARLLAAWVPEDEALANLRAAHAPVARNSLHFYKQNLLI